MKTQTVSLIILIMTTFSSAAMMVNNEFKIDFADPNSVSQHIVVWTPQNKIRQTEKGLVFKHPHNNASVDFSVLTKPYALGLSWRPAYSANLGVELSPMGKVTAHNGHTLFPPLYSVYVRYSPDMKNWSSWHLMQDKHRDWQERIKANAYQYSLRLRVPQQQRKNYNEYFTQYRQMDVPWDCDEEAMVKWMLQQEPDFFKKQIPIVGYVQFLCETSMRANQPLTEAKINIHWGVGGLHSIPKDKSVYKNVAIQSPGCPSQPKKLI